MASEEADSSRKSEGGQLTRTEWLLPMRHARLISLGILFTTRKTPESSAHRHDGFEHELRQRFIRHGVSH